MDLPNNADIVSPAQNLQLITTLGRLVYVSETFNRFADLGPRIARKCVWRLGSAWTHWESYSAPPGPLAVIRGTGREGREGKGKGWE